MGSWDFLDEPAGSDFATDPFSGGSYLDRFSAVPDTTPLYAPNRSFFGDVASNLGRGGVEAIGLFGHSLDQFGIETGLEEWASGAEERYSFMRPDLEEALGQEGWFKRSAMGALRSAPATLVPLAAAGAGTIAGTPALGAAAGIGTLVGMFGAGTYNQTYRENVDELGEDAAHKLALEVAAWEVGTEGISDAAAVLTGGLLGAPVKGIFSSVSKGVQPTLKSVMQSGAANFLKATGINVGTETMSESLNSFMQTRAEIKAGLDPGLTPGQAALASIGPSLFLSGGITLGTQSMGAINRNRIVNILKSEETTAEQKSYASALVEGSLRRENTAWADNWKEVSDHIIKNGGVFDINQDFVTQASQLSKAQTPEEVQQETERKDMTEVLTDPDAVWNDVLFGDAETQALPVDERMDALLAQYDPDPPAIDLNRKIESEYDQYQPDLPSPFGSVLQNLYDTYKPEAPAPKRTQQEIEREAALAREERLAAGYQPELPIDPGRRGIPELGAQAEGVEMAGLEREIAQVEELAAEEAATAEANRLFDIEFEQGWAAKARAEQTDRSLTEYFRHMMGQADTPKEKGAAARIARETQQKLQILGVPPESKLAPELYSAIQTASLADVQERGLEAVTEQMPEAPADFAAEKQKPQRTLTPQERAQLVQATEEYNAIQDRLGIGQEGDQQVSEVMSPEDQVTLRELEAEIRNLTGKTDEDIETIVPGIGATIPEQATAAEPPTGAVENALRTQQRRIDTQVSEGAKTDREGRTEQQLIQGLVDNDVDAISAALSQYTDKGQLAALTDTALQFRDALLKPATEVKRDKDGKLPPLTDRLIEDTPGNRQLLNRVYQLISSYSAEPAGRELPKGFVEWTKVPTKGAGEMYTAVDEVNDKMYFAERQTTKAGERGGRWRIYSTKEDADGNVTEETLEEGAKDQPLASLVRKFYRTSGEGPLGQEKMPEFIKKQKVADRTGPYTSDGAKSFWKSKDGVWVAVPRGSRDGKRVWGVMREADRAQWWDLTPKERTAAWYKVDGKSTLSQEEALNVVKKEIGAEDLEITENLIDAESEYLTEFKEQEQEVGLEMGSRGPTKGKPGKTRGAGAKVEQQAKEAAGEGEVKQVSTKRVPGGRETQLYRVEAKRAEDIRQLETELDRNAGEFLKAFADGHYGKMRIIRQRVFETLGYRKDDKAPKSVQDNVDTFLNGAIALDYQDYNAQVDTLQGQIDKVQRQKEAVQSQKKTSALDDTTGYDSQIRGFNRELAKLRKEQAKLNREQDLYGKKAAKYLGISQKLTGEMMSNLSQGGRALLVPATPTVRKKPAALAKAEAEAAARVEDMKKNPPTHTFTLVPSIAKKGEGSRVVGTQKGHTIYETPAGFIVETPEGVKTKPYKTKANAKKFVIDKFEAQSKHQGIQFPKAPVKEKTSEGTNDWTRKNIDVLQSDNGKFTAQLVENERVSPFQPGYQWVVENNKGEEVAYFATAEEVMNGINGATKSGYIPKRAKGTAKLFSIGETTEERSGNSAQAVASSLTRFLGKEGTRKWTGRITVVQSLDEASGVGNEIKARGVDGPVLGYYNPATNQVTLVADSIQPGQEQDVFLHEGLHFVMENDGDFVRTKDALLKRITNLKNKDGAVRNAWLEAEQKNPNASEKHIAEEAYAYLLQNPDNRQVGVVRQALAAIKRFLIKMRIPVGALGLTDGDLVSMATTSIRNLRNVQEMDDANLSFQATQFAPDEVRRKKMEDDRFKGFFGNSLVKEKGTGYPIVLYSPSSAPGVNPEEATRTLGETQDPSLMPYLGINLTNEDRAMNTADQGSVFGYYARVENPRRITAKQLNAGISTPEDAVARKKVFELDGHDGLFIMSGPGPNAVVERVIVFNNNQIQPSEKAYRQVNQASIKFSTADAPNAEIEVPETTPERSQTGEQLSAKSTLQDDGGRWRVFAPLTESTPKDNDGKWKSDTVFKNTLTDKYYHYTNFNTDTQEYDGQSEISRAEYQRLSEQYSGEQEIKDREYWQSNVGVRGARDVAAEKGKDWLQKTKQTAKDALESISEAVKKISPKAYGRLNRMEFEIQDTVRRYGKRVTKFLKQYDTLGAQDKWILDQALRNGDFRARNRVLQANDMEEGWNEVQSVLNEIKEGMAETGLIDDAQLLKNYFPRSIRTGQVDNLVASMRSSDAEFNTVLGDEMAKLEKTLEAEGRTMTEADRLTHIQKLMNTGHYQFIPKPGASKDRNITNVKNDQAQFYDDTATALEGHIYDTVQGIEYRRLLGKNNLSRPRLMKQIRGLTNQIEELQANDSRSEKENVRLKELMAMHEMAYDNLSSIDSDLDQSIASYVDEELGKGNEKASELIHLIRARLTQRGTHGFWGSVRDAGYMFTLGSPMSAITQIGDLALSAYANRGRLGDFNTTAAIFNAIVSRVRGDKRMTKDYFDFSHSLGDFSKSGIENKGTQYALDKVLTWSGLKGMDLFGKDVFLNAALSKNKKMSADDFLKNKLALFGGDKVRALKAHRNIKRGKLDTESKDELFVLFNDLSQWQPISLSEMPKLYNTSGNGRIFYMLKSFNLKAINSIRREVTESWEAGNKTAAAMKGMGIVMAISLAGAGADEIKDFILGKEVDFSDNVIDNLISMTLTNRFTLEKGIQQGAPFTSIVNGLMPPMRFADQPITDMYKFLWDRENFQFKSANLIPVVGRIGYSYSESGRETELNNRKRNLYDQIRENARAGRSLYAGTVRANLQAYNDLARDLKEDRLGYKQLKNVRSKEKKKMREEARG